MPTIEDYKINPEIAVPLEVYEDIWDYIRDHQQDIELDINDFGKLKNILGWMIERQKAFQADEESTIATESYSRQIRSGTIKALEDLELSEEYCDSSACDDFQETIKDLLGID